MGEIPAEETKEIIQHLAGQIKKSPDYGSMKLYAYMHFDRHPNKDKNLYTETKNLFDHRFSADWIRCTNSFSYMIIVYHDPEIEVVMEDKR